MHMIRHGKRIDIWAPAKLNLFLELIARREDGYHELESLMVPISVFDTLTVQPNATGRIAVSCRWATGLDLISRVQSRNGESPLGDLPSESDNIVHRAVLALRDKAGVETGLTLQIVKRIPTRAGLGGASSDAAAALLAANLAWKLGWSRDRLCALAAELGSDVPFFLWATPAICRGRGEIVKPVGPAPRLPMVVAKPPNGLSTREVYEHSDVPDVPRMIGPILSALRNSRADLLGGQLFNRLQSAATRLSPWIQHAQRMFDRVGIRGHMMSGSGTSYFGICRHDEHARRTAAMLRASRLGGIMTVSTLGPPCRGCPALN